MKLRFREQQSNGNASTALMNLLCYEISGKAVTSLYLKKQWAWETARIVLLSILQLKFAELQDIQLLHNGSYRVSEINDGRECCFAINLEVRLHQALTAHWSIWHFWMDKETGPKVEFMFDEIMGL